MAIIRRLARTGRSRPARFESAWERALTESQRQLAEGRLHWATLSAEAQKLERQAQAEAAAAREYARAAEVAARCGDVESAARARDRCSAHERAFAFFARGSAQCRTAVERLGILLEGAQQALDELHRKLMLHSARVQCAQAVRAAQAAVASVADGWATCASAMGRHAELLEAEAEAYAELSRGELPSRNARSSAAVPTDGDVGASSALRSEK